MTLIFRQRRLLSRSIIPFFIEQRYSDSIRMGDHRPTVDCIQSDGRFDGFDNYAPDISTPSPSASKGGGGT